MQMSSFRNPKDFDKELNFGSSGVRRYSISVNALTLDKLLSRLTEEVHIPDQEEEILRAVSIVGKNKGIGGEPVWCLNKNLSIDKNGWAIKASDFGLEWIGHLTEAGSGLEIADETYAANVEGEMTTAYFDAMAHLLAGSLQKKAAEDQQLKMVVSELFSQDECLCLETEIDDIEMATPYLGTEASTEDTNPLQNQGGRSIELHRDNFLLQFYMASMGIIMANYQEVRIVGN